MVQEQIPEELDQEIKADSTYAQILIKIANTSKAIEDANRIIKELGIHIIGIRHLSANWILFKLDVKDMRDITLTLIEHGFIVKGINALPEVGITTTK
jgi:hypothetical protein